MWCYHCVSGHSPSDGLLEHGPKEISYKGCMWLMFQFNSLSICLLFIKQSLTYWLHPFLVSLLSPVLSCSYTVSGVSRQSRTPLPGLPCWGCAGMAALSLPPDSFLTLTDARSFISHTQKKIWALRAGHVLPCGGNAETGSGAWPWQGTGHSVAPQLHWMLDCEVSGLWKCTTVLSEPWGEWITQRDLFIYQNILWWRDSALWSN